MFTVPNSLISVPSPLNRVPCMRAFGTGFPPKFWYPSRVHKYKPLNMPTLQTRASAAACAVADVPSVIAAITLTNAQAASKELIMLLTNFVFISANFLLSFGFLLLFWPSLIAHHEKSVLAVHFLFSPDCAEKVSGNLLKRPRITRIPRMKLTEARHELHPPSPRYGEAGEFTRRMQRFW